MMTDRKFNKHRRRRCYNGLVLYNRVCAKDQLLCKALHTLDHRVTHIRTCLEAPLNTCKDGQSDQIDGHERHCTDAHSSLLVTSF